MYDMLKNIDPPLGFGNKCPNRLAYKKLIRMNMPLDEEKRVNFTTTLFGLIRENLNIKMRPAEEMDQADEELRGTIQMIWPFQAKKMLDLLIPRSDRLNKMNLTVGKVYAGLLILESWRNTKFGQIESGIPVSDCITHILCLKFWFLDFDFSFCKHLLLIKHEASSTTSLIQSALVNRDIRFVTCLFLMHFEEILTFDWL